MGGTGDSAEGSSGFQTPGKREVTRADLGLATPRSLPYTWRRPQVLTPTHFTPRQRGGRSSLRLGSYARAVVFTQRAEDAGQERREFLSRLSLLNVIASPSPTKPISLPPRTPSQRAIPRLEAFSMSVLRRSYPGQPDEHLRMISANALMPQLVAAMETKLRTTPSETVEQLIDEYENRPGLRAFFRVIEEYTIGHRGDQLFPEVLASIFPEVIDGDEQFELACDATRILSKLWHSYHAMLTAAYKVARDIDEIPEKFLVEKIDLTDQDRKHFQPDITEYLRGRMKPEPGKPADESLDKILSPSERGSASPSAERPPNPGVALIFEVEANHAECVRDEFALLFEDPLDIHKLIHGLLQLSYTVRDVINHQEDSAFSVEYFTTLFEQTLRQRLEIYSKKELQDVFKRLIAQQAYVQGFINYSHGLICDDGVQAFVSSCLSDVSDADLRRPYWGRELSRSGTILACFIQVMCDMTGEEYDAREVEKLADAEIKPLAEQVITMAYENRERFPGDYGLDETPTGLFYVDGTPRVSGSRMVRLGTPNSILFPSPSHPVAENSFPFLWSANPVLMAAALGALVGILAIALIPGGQVFAAGLLGSASLKAVSVGLCIAASSAVFALGGYLFKRHRGAPVSTAKPTSTRSGLTPRAPSYIQPPVAEYSWTLRRARRRVAPTTPRTPSRFTEGSSRSGIRRG